MATERKHSNGQQGTAGEAEQAQRAAEMRTQGRKGCKAVRINMALSTENHEFVKLLSKASGQTMTNLVNSIVAAYRKEHPELTRKAKEYIDFINDQKW